MTLNFIIDFVMLPPEFLSVSVTETYSEFDARDLQYGFDLHIL